MAAPTPDPSSSDLSTGWGLLPRPLHVEGGRGHLTVARRVSVHGPPDWVDALRTLVTPGSGLRFDEAADPLVRLREDDQQPAEGYDLTVDESGITLRASERAGVLHGIQTLRQLLPAWASGLAPVPGRRIVLPHTNIRDAPRFAWRGMHLDVARHFQPLASLFRLVDLLAMHKLNVLHLHLTDDQGWRFEVLALPLLTDVGAVRAQTRLPAWADGDATPHGGFYTQDQLRSLVAHALERGVTIVPEIDLPGHVRSLLAAYPQFGEPGASATTVATTPEIFREVLHLGDATIAMIETVLTELLDVFPSRDIHVGGDECPREQWRASRAAAELAAGRGLAGVDELQPWFTRHLRGWLAERGRRLVGWDEIIDDGARVPGAVVMSWRGSEPAARAASQGNDVVLAAPPFYFDFYQSPSPDEPYAIGGLSTWEDVLATDPYAGLPVEHRAHLLGIQGQVWTEYLPTAQQVEYMTFPRAAALAELAWSQEPATAREFGERLRRQAARLDASGVNHRPLDGPRAWQRGGTGRLARPGQHGGT